MKTKGRVTNTSASMLGVSFSDSETRFDDLFQLHPAPRHNRWPFVTSHSRMEQIYPFSFGRVWQPYTEEVFSPYQQKQPSVSSYPVIEDEETCHGFLAHIGGGGSMPSPELRPTVSTVNNPIQLGSTNTAVEQVRLSAEDCASGFNAHQLTSSFQNLQVSTHNQLRAVEPSSHSFTPYAEYPSVHPMATHRRSMEHTAVSTLSDKSDSMESEQPADLSMPKNAHQNLDSGNTVDDDPCKNVSASRDTYYRRSESPIHRLTYTHLSDVSNDSEEGSDENLKNPTRFTRGFAKKRFEKLVPHQLALPWISTHPTTERPNISTFDPTSSYAQVFVEPSVRPAIASCIFWLLQSHFLDKINELSHEAPNKNQKEKIVELGDNCYEHSDATPHGINVADEHVQPVAEEYEVIDLTQDDDDDEGGMGNEQLYVQPPAACPPSDQQLLAEVPTVEQTSEQSALPLQGSTSPVLTLTLPPASHLESSPLPVDSIMSPEEDSTDHGFCSQTVSCQNFSEQLNFCIPPHMLKEHTDSPQDKCMRQRLTDTSSTQLLLPDSSALPIRQCEKRPYRESEPVCKAAHCSGPKQLRRSPRLQSVVKESKCASENRKMRPQNQQSCHRQKAADQNAQSMAPSQLRRSPRLEDEARKCSLASEKRSREPWNHKGLLRFVAQNAFNLPRHFWTERKEGEPRRSMRLAKKMQRRRYFLRPRLHTKS